MKTIKKTLLAAAVASFFSAVDYTLKHPLI